MKIKSWSYDGISMVPDDKGRFVKLEDYEELLNRFQSNCPHTYGRMSGNRCACCYHDMSICQHRNSERSDKFCKDCGSKLHE